ncbi:MAG: hypothetical protein QOF18_324 [Frankiaceae bacterium]|nr:hypothetical protein [Frankiaceae bacterium]
MTRRFVAVLATTVGPDAALSTAMLEDVVDMAEAMQQAEAALVTTGALAETARAVAWPGMPVLELDAASASDVAAALDAVHAAGADEVALVCPDAPDLPPLLLGKLFSALTTAEVAACPAEGGGLVALAARLPVAAWLRELAPGVDDPDALFRLQAAAPQRAFHAGPGWHRVRTAADVSLLDAGLEGWETTRALLAGR